ncbi:hypothetical protein FVW20_03845 [Desulfovibrio oxamicus]|uniref:Uncharacterized protein n=2 Tax=Nitratidesulfovibrio oxamicus TaxID=32016 RepID=A0ABS0J177_9BACT|nr:hypothetical protein [Nitratidesulfovibrio oxamicus]
MFMPAFRLAALRRAFGLTAPLACICLVLLLLTAPEARAAGFYEQPPFDNAELTRFIDDFPRFRDWVKRAGEAPHPSVGADGLPGFEYSAPAAAELERMGWKPERFFFIMGRSAAALADIEEGDALAGANRPADMPQVTPAETELVRRQLASLLRAVMGE